MRRFPELVAGNFNYKYCKNPANNLPVCIHMDSALHIDYSRLIFFIPLWTNLIYYNNHKNTI
jgi:hypothetical protein